MLSADPTGLPDGQQLLLGERAQGSVVDACASRRLRTTSRRQQAAEGQQHAEAAGRSPRQDEMIKDLKHTAPFKGKRACEQLAEGDQTDTKSRKCGSCLSRGPVGEVGNRRTCPINPECTNPMPEKHPKAMQQLWDEDRPRYATIMQQASERKARRPATRSRDDAATPEMAVMMAIAEGCQTSGHSTTTKTHARLTITQGASTEVSAPAGWEAWTGATESRLVQYPRRTGPKPGAENPEDDQAAGTQMVEYQGHAALERARYAPGMDELKRCGAHLVRATGGIVLGMGVDAGECAVALGKEFIPSSETAQAVLEGAVDLAQLGARAVPKVRGAVGATARTSLRATRSAYHGATAVIKGTVKAALRARKAHIDDKARRKRHEHTKIIYENLNIEKGKMQKGDKRVKTCDSQCMICSAASIKYHSPCCAVIRVKPPKEEAEPNEFARLAMDENYQHVCLCRYCANIIHDEDDVTGNRSRLIPVRENVYGNGLDFTRWVPDNGNVDNLARMMTAAYYGLIWLRTEGHEGTEEHLMYLNHPERTLANYDRGVYDASMWLHGRRG